MKQHFFTYRILGIEAFGTKLWGWKDVGVFRSSVNLNFTWGVSIIRFLKEDLFNAIQLSKEFKSIP
jgi:hypothetical protein